MMSRLWLCALLAMVPAAGQVAELKHRIEKLRTVGRVLMIAAHPDDENTAFLAYCAQGRHLETGYLSLTRGEGGQNLIGSEQGDLLGVIRTEELLAARRIDGAEQFFTRAIDFGFSKNAQETLEKWGKNAVLSDVVYRIRRFRPDVIVLRFSGTPRDGHGHHQSSAILGKEAFSAAADPKQFPEQLSDVEPWQAKRILWNGFSFSRQQEQELEAMPKPVKVDLGAFDPLLGKSYGEIAGISRSQHRSQGMGSPQRMGSMQNYLFVVGGAEASTDFMEGVDVSWRRLPGGVEVEDALRKVSESFDVDHPERLIPGLIEARRRMRAIDHPDARAKVREADEAIAMAAGLWLEVSASQSEAVRGQQVRLSLTAVSRLAEGITLDAVLLSGLNGAPAMIEAPVALKRNELFQKQADLRVPENEEFTQPYWLTKPREGNLYGVKPREETGNAALTAHFRLRISGEALEIVRPVEHRYVDRVRGELTRPFVVVPAVSARITHPSIVFPDAKPRKVSVEARASVNDVTMDIRLQAPAGWRVEPAAARFAAKEKGETRAFEFMVTPPAGAAQGELRVAGGTEVIRLGYEHIPPQTIQPEATAQATRADVKMAARKIGYVMGAGDEVPDALRQLGCDVTLLSAQDLALGDLSLYDAIITGVRAWNVREDLRASYERLREYALRGGVVVVQYNILEGGPFRGDSSALSHIGPLALTISRERVSVEDAPVKVLRPEHVLLNSPNRITPEDFEGWVQERGLYFPSDWAAGYDALLEMSDPGEKPLQGGLLAARTGKGMYIVTTLSFFRQLPAGVPGAYRLFANLVSGGRAQ